VRKFVNHVDHVVWISRLETLDANVAELERITEAELQYYVRKDLGFAMYISWEAGLEIVAPLPEPTAFNEELHEWLAARGEGVKSVVFGVRDLEAHKARLEALGFDVGPELQSPADTPWHDKLALKERILGTKFMNGYVVMGDIDYADGVVRFEETDPRTR
jgi:hypothetical protein